MAESPIAKLKRLQAEKKAKLAVATQVTQVEPMEQTQQTKQTRAVSEEVAPVEVVTKMEPASKLPAPAGDDPIYMMLAELEEKLDKKIPDFANVLQKIWRHLAGDPAIATILKEEEIALIVKGLEQHGNITIVEPKANGRRSSKTQPVTAEML